MTYPSAIELGTILAERIPALAADKTSPSAWTTAVHEALKEFSIGQAWTVYPPDKPYSQEYLCDFMLFEDGYGCRVACESQWNHQRWHSHQGSLDWAFDKLRGVKADVKLFICEGEQAQWDAVVKNYLMRYAQLSPDETFVVLRWQGDHFVKTWWTPQKAGVQQELPNFKEF